MKAWAQQFRTKSQLFLRKQYCQFETIWDKSSRRKKTGIFVAVYTILFLATFLLAYSPFLLNGKSFIWKTDGRNQHYPALVYIGRYLRQIVLNLFHGEFSIPQFDLNIGAGDDVIAALNYYGFGNPLNLLAVFVPTRYIEYLYDFLVAFRIYLSGLTFSALCIYHGKRMSFTLTGALLYAYCGYTIYSAVRHPFFMDPMIQLPLLLLGADQVVARKKPFIFVGAVLYSALCGYYFLYMTTIMLGIYALVRFFEYYPENRVKEFIGMAGRLAGSYLLGIGTSAIIFIPAVAGFFFSSRTGRSVERELWDYLSWGWTHYHDSLLKWIAPPGGLAPLALGAIVLPALVLLFSIRKKEYRTLKLLFAVCMVIYVLPLGGYIMNGFQYPANRWAFALPLLLSYIVVEMMPVLLNLNRRQTIFCVITLVVYTLCVFVGPRNRGVNYVVGDAMLAVTLVVLFLLNNMDAKGMQNIGAAVCILLVIGNVSVNAIYKFAADQGNYINEFMEHGYETKRLETVLEREAEPLLGRQDGRFDSDSKSFSRNTGMVWRVPTLCSFWSMSNASTINYWKETENVGQMAGDFNLYGADQRTISDTLLSTKYFIGKEKRLQYLPYGYKLIQETKNGNFLYENQYALPWGYTYDNSISYAELEQMNGLEAEEAMLQSIALEEKAEGIPAGSIKSNIENVPYEITKMTDVKWEGETLSVTKANAVITLEFQMPAKTEGYLRLQGFDINGSGIATTNVMVNCTDVSKEARAVSLLDTAYFVRENYLFNLGYSEEERASCTITFPKKGTFKLEAIELFALPMDKYPEQVEALRAEVLENVVMGTNQISGTVDLSANKILCMSIPYKKGWTAAVDGEKVEIQRGNYMFMAIPLTEGHHEIEFTYHSVGIRAGALISLMSFAVLAILWRRSGRKMLK